MKSKVLNSEDDRKCNSIPSLCGHRSRGRWAVCFSVLTRSSSLERSTPWFTCIYLNPQEKGFTVAIGLVGTVIGALGAGHAGQRLGSRETLRITALLYLVSALGCGLAWSWASFMAFRLVGGLGIGASSVLGPVYIAELFPGEVARPARRASSSSMSCSGLWSPTFRIMQFAPCTWAPLEWRWQVGVATAPAIFFLVLLFGIPRSPRWLDLHAAEFDEARSVTEDVGDPDPDAALADIQEALSQEHVQMRMSGCSNGNTAILCFLPSQSGRFNQLAGINAILYYLNNIFAAAGFSQVSSDQQAVAVGVTPLRVHHCGYVTDRQTGAQETAADRRCGLRQLPGGRGVGVQERRPIREPCCGC